jgi:hypothetical protein
MAANNAAMAPAKASLRSGEWWAPQYVPIFFANSSTY